MISRLREVARALKAARVSTALTEEHPPPSQPQGGMTIMEGGEKPPSLERWEVISLLGSMYGKEVTKKVQDLLRDSNPF